MSERGRDGHYDAVIVGSGFGGAVTAYRLAEAGLSTVVLERGRAYPPGSFPRSPQEMGRNFWNPRGGMHGMFHYWTFRGIDVVVSSGLGGGSLIYANVLIRKDERWFVREDVHDGGYEHWPVTRADLDPHYDRAEAMLGAQRYPFDHAPYDGTAKTRAFKTAAEANGLDWFLPNLAVTFANPGEPPVPGEPIVEEHPNLHGRSRTTCRLCGECDIGCNYGAKNTLDYNYLTAARRHGAELRTGCDVRRLSPLDGGGYRVEYIDYDDGPGANGRSGLRSVTADRLILGAGTLGSTALLLRNRSAFPRISRRLGARFCGNGDLLCMAVKCSEHSGDERVPMVIDPSFGPVITSAVRVPDALDGGEGRGFYVEDAGLPQHATWALQALSGPGSLWRWRKAALHLVTNWLRGTAETDITADFSEFFGGSELSAGLLPLLSMGRDVPDGRMRLRRGEIDIEWKRKKSGPYFERVRKTSRDMTRTLGGRFVDNPIWFLNRVITVHPLGGCPMGRTSGEGVVDSSGQVFGYPGLYIADGSVMPGPVGPNPSLTIAALADRFADRILEPRLAEAEAALA
jgi:cholesterol oxidase